METELYKKYRPQTLDEVVGNEAIITSLKSLIKGNKVPHTILLSGPSGCGKTTIARILQHELECGESDFEEYNCSDRNGVDFGREIISRMRFKPMNGKCRIWLLDECHQMSTACANVLLKPLEDTPAHVYFILSTSEPDKIIKALQTRCTHYAVQSLSSKNIDKLLTNVAKLEEIKLTKEAKDQIIENCNGSARMALVMLDQIKNLDEEEIEDVVKSISNAESQTIDLCRCLISGRSHWTDARTILAGLKEDPEKVRRSVLGYATKVLLSPSGNYEQAFLVIQCFQNSFFNSGMAGLVGACYDVITDGGRK